MPLKTVRLELARSHEFPEGRADCGYELRAPLKADGALDLEEWKKNRAACAVRRFWKGADDEQGRLAHGRGGWYFDYDPKDEADDEPVFKLDRHAFKAGEYISVTEHDGVQRTFRVAAVK